jgi:cell division septation protein DedD
MDSALKQRLIGAAVLVALAMIFLPMLLQGPDVREPDAAQVPLSMPDAPDQEFETRELPLAAPEPLGEGEAVLGVPAAPDDPNAVATVEAGTEAAPRVDFAEPADDGAPLQAVDAATGQPQPAAPAAAATESAPPAATPTPAPAPTPAAPAPAPAPAAPLPASAAGGRYAVNVGSFSNLANARALADKLRAQGLPVTSESVDVNGKPAMRLRVGPYAERALAEAARLRAESVTGGSAAVIALDANAAAPAASAPAPATRAPAAASVGFAVQLGALSNEADATALRDKARAAGFTAFHQRIATERGVVWRVRVGPEADRAAAERLRDSVAAKLGLRDAIIVPHP